MIKLSNDTKISKYFYLSEATFLPKIQEFYIPSLKELDNIQRLAKKLDKVRDFIGLPFSVNVWIRPNNFVNSKKQVIDYNALVGGVKNSAHITGSAVDGIFKGIDLDISIQEISKKLNEFELSMEQNGTAYGRNWIHLQDKAMTDGKFRIFLP